MEELGYDELWVVEDCFLGGGLALAGAALAASRSLTVGVGLLPVSVRNPAIAAMEIATLARLYPGRLSVAFGHGVEAWMRQIGARPADRIVALRETVSAVRGLLAGQRVSVSGRTVTLDAVELGTPPQITPEIVVGTTGSKGIAVAARHADGILLPEGCGPDFVAQTRAEAAASADGAAVAVVAYVWFAADEPGARRGLTKSVDSWAHSGLYPGPLAASGWSGDASLDEVTAELSVSGAPPASLAATERFLAAGVNRLILTAFGPDPEAEYAWYADAVLAGARRSSVSPRA